MRTASDVARYKLVVRPGIFKDGTFGVYASPTERPELEYQIRARFDSSTEASEYAEQCRKFAPQIFEKPPEIRDDREMPLPPITVNESEEASVAALKQSVESLMSTPSGLKRVMPWARLSAGTPYLLSFAAVVAYFFKISLTIPKDIPLLGEYLGGTTLSPDRIAVWFPIILVVLVIIMQLRARRIGLEYADVRDNILYLALKCGWRRDRFIKLTDDIIRSKGYGWLRKLYTWVYAWDPNTFTGVVQSLNIKLTDEGEIAKFNDELTKLCAELNDEDFECRIHALYYMSSELSFRPWVMILPPLQMLLCNRRAVRRTRGILRYGLVDGLIFLDLAALPGGDDHRLIGRLFWIFSIWPLTILGGALLWSFLKHPWVTPLGWLGMASAFALTLGPILFWNYHLMVNWRGLPRGMAWVDLQGSLRLIRAQ